MALVGVPATWSLDRWLFANVWESESGPTKQDVCTREYYWGAAACWIDERRVVIGGIGECVEEMIQGARVFDIMDQDSTSRMPRELMTFAGPAGEFFSDGIALFSSDETGLSRFFRSTQPNPAFAWPRTWHVRAHDAVADVSYAGYRQ